MKVNYSRVLLGFIDIVLINSAMLLALMIRFDGFVPSEYWLLFRQAALPVTIINLSCFYFFGLYNQVWVYASINALISVVDAVFCASLFAAGYLWLFEGGRMPYSVMIISCLLSLLFIGGSRFAWRVAREKLFNTNHARRKNALIFGAGDAGEVIAREMVRGNGNSEYFPVGFIDDDRNKKGMDIHGVKVLGDRHDIPRIVASKHIGEVILAVPSASGEIVRDIVNICKSSNVASKTLPSLYELINGQISINQIRDVNEEDLLKRDPVIFDLKEVECEFKGKTVLITGAGGSIGSELSRQIALCHPRELILLGHGENSIYNIDLEIREKFHALSVQSIIGNVRDRDKIFKVMHSHKPHFVFHAAAYKHVHLMEAHPDEAIANNVFGTRNVAEASLSAGVEKFVLISTDKAVNPAGVMGASKRLAELLILSLQRDHSTQFIITRFGNVLGSRGSVIPFFKRQIKKGGPLTVTHPDVVRFFMTIPEAVHLVIRAALMGRGGEIFVLDMGEPTKIVDLAKDLITLSGFECDKDIKIEFTGLRPGEKLFEELAGRKEHLEATSHKKIYVAKPANGGLEQCLDQINRLKDMVENSDNGELKRKLGEMANREGALICCRSRR